MGSNFHNSDITRSTMWSWMKEGVCNNNKLVKVQYTIYNYLLSSSVCTATGVDGGPGATVVAVIVTR